MSVKRGIGLITAAALAMACVSGCGSQDISLVETEEKINIDFSWWGSDSRHDYTMEAVKQFEELHPNIDVHLQYSEWTGYDKKSAIQMAANTEADVMQINFSWLNKFSPDGTGYYDLEKLTQNLDLGAYSSDDLAYGRSGGTLNALPIALNSKVFLYNKDMYASYGLELPQTWGDLEKAAAVMGKDGVYPLDLDTICAFMCSVAYVEQNTGKSFFDANNKLAFTEADVKAMLEFYMGLVDKKAVTYLGERNDSYYKEGKVAGVAQWITNAAKYQKDLSENAGQATEIGQIPVLPGAPRTGWYVKPATMYAISKNTEHPDEAAMFLDFLVNSEEMASLQLMEKGVPVSGKAQSVLTGLNEMNGIQVDAEKVVNATSTDIMSPYYENSGLQEAFSSATNAVYYDGEDIDTAAKAAYRAMVEDLQ